MAKKRKNSKNQTTRPIAPAGRSESFWANHILPISILFVLPFLLYASSIGFEYVLDDKIVITDNAFVKKGIAGIGDIFTTDSFQGYFGEQKNVLEGGRYRPLSLVTFAIEYELFGLSSKVGHLGNILIYAICGLLLFRVLLLLMPPSKNSRWFLTLPFVASLLFVLHPIHTEVVANIKGRDEILALLFSLSALYFSLKYIDTRKTLNLVLAGITLFLGILAKENALTWIAIIPLSIYYFRKEGGHFNLALLGVLVFTALAYLGMRYQILGYLLSTGQESQDIMNNPFVGLAFSEKYATIIYTLGQYIKLLVFPHPLTHDYYPYQIPIIGFADWRALLALLINLGLGIYALFNLRKKSIISYGILFYFITLSIVSNLIVNVGTTMNERFIYMPSVGFCIVLAYFIARWLPNKLNEKPNEINILSVGLLAILILAYSAKTLLRVPDWKNALTLNSAAVKFSPNSARANCFMGVALFEDFKLEQDANRKNLLLTDVTYYIDRSLDLYPAYGAALTMKSGVAAENYKQDGDINKLLNGFTKVLNFRTTNDFIDEYLEYLIRQNRNPNEVFSFLYRIGYEVNFQQRADFTTAIHYLNYANQLKPNNPQVLQALGQSYQKLGNQSKANEYFQKLGQ